jgi:anti-sigma regulatory factor (Ser/Thr protein kinase)
MFHSGGRGDPAPTHPKRRLPVSGKAVPPVTAAPAAATARRSSISFPATSSQITDARRFVASFLADSPLAGDAVLCLSEVATNSVIHSNSRRVGGQFTVSAERYDNGRVRIEVEDDGGSWIERKKPEGQPHFGLLIVSQLACEWGITHGGRGTRTVWFELAQDPPAEQAAA